MVCKENMSLKIFIYCIIGLGSIILLIVIYCIVKKIRIHLKNKKRLNKIFVDPSYLK